MSDNHLQSCPKCNQGKMRPTGKAGTDQSIHDPFSETNDARRYECDNCGHVQFNAKMTESLGVSDSVSASVEKKDGSYEKGLFPQMTVTQAIYAMGANTLAMSVDKHANDNVDSISLPN